MTEHEIKNMFSDIINNGAEYKCRPIGDDSSWPPKCYEWQLYKLGEEIRSDYEYRKVIKYVVVKRDDEYSVGLKSVLSPKVKIYFESISEEECKKWIDDHASWIEKNYGEPYWINDDVDANEIRVDAIEEFVKEFLSRVYKDAKDHNDDLLSIEDLENIIKEMGVKSC